MNKEIKNPNSILYHDNGTKASEDQKWQQKSFILSKQKMKHHQKTCAAKQVHTSSNNTRRNKCPPFCNRWAHLQRVGSNRPNALMPVMMLSVKQMAEAPNRSWLSSGARKWLKSSSHTPPHPKVLDSHTHPPFPHLHWTVGSFFPNCYSNKDLLLLFKADV